MSGVRIHPSQPAISQFLVERGRMAPCYCVQLIKQKIKSAFKVGAFEKRVHPFPFRTRKLSFSASMVLLRGESRSAPTLSADFLFSNTGNLTFCIDKESSHDVLSPSGGEKWDGTHFVRGCRPSTYFFKKVSAGSYNLNSACKVDSFCKKLSKMTDIGCPSFSHKKPADACWFFVWYVL